ncbi:hypothetical protein SERLADRAFT_381112, partial [Serpula lacrymans var. lacrymans S7.9]
MTVTWTARLIAPTGISASSDYVSTLYSGRRFRFRNVVHNLGHCRSLILIHLSPSTL